MKNEVRYGLNAIVSEILRSLNPTTLKPAHPSLPAGACEGWELVEGRRVLLALHPLCKQLTYLGEVE